MSKKTTIKDKMKEMIEKKPVFFSELDELSSRNFGENQALYSYLLRLFREIRMENEGFRDFKWHKGVRFRIFYKEEHKLGAVYRIFKKYPELKEDEKKKTQIIKPILGKDYRMIR